MVYPDSIYSGGRCTVVNCDPPCLNGGTCEAINVTFSECNCAYATNQSSYWEGPYCEISKISQFS